MKNNSFIASLLFNTLFVVASASAFAETGNELQWAQAHADEIRAAKVVFFGEAHADVAAKEHLPELIQAIQSVDSSYDCLGLEMPADHQESLERYLAGKQTREEFTLGEFLWSKPDQIDSKIQQAHLKMRMDQQKQWLIAANLIKPSMKTLLIDLPWSSLATVCRDNYKQSKIKDEAALYCVGPRNRFMAKKIQSLIQQHQCKKMVILNGVAHLYEFGTSPIQSYLKLPSFVVPFLSRDFGGESRPQELQDLIRLEPNEITGGLI